MNKVNEVYLAEVKKCFPERAVLRPCKPRQGLTSINAFSIQVLCDPSMGEKETEYCMESVRQILPVQEFYSGSQGHNIFIMWHYDKTKPVEFII